MLKRRQLLRRCGYGFAGIALVLIAYRLLSVSEENIEETPQPIVAATSHPRLSIADALNTTNPPETVEEAVVDDQEYTEPLHELVATEEQSRALYEAEEMAISLCMNERGFEYVQNRYLSDDELDPWGDTVTPGDVDAAGELGYGVSVALDSEGLPLPPDPNQNLISSLGEAERAAWDETFGGKEPDLSAAPQEGPWANVEVPGLGMVAWDTESCLASAQRTIYGDDRVRMQDEVLEMQLREQVDTLTEQDANYQKALQDWRGCMAEKGLTYRYPGEPSSSLRQQFQQGTLDRAALLEKEIEIATQDAQCFQVAGVGVAHNEAERRADAEVRQKHGEDINRLKVDLNTAVKRSEQLLSSRNNE